MKDYFLLFPFSKQKHLVQNAKYLCDWIFSNAFWLQPNAKQIMILYKYMYIPE